MDLVADLYEVTMAAGYLRRGMTAPATFSLFVRRTPPGRGFLVAAGVDDALDALESFGVTAADVAGLASLLGCPGNVLAPLAGLRFTGDVRAVREASVVLPDEPLLEVTAPLPQAQLVESLVLNAVTYRTALATKAVRVVLAAAGRTVVDFALRRTHGLEAADSVALLTAVAGFAATSNVHAASRYGLAVTGTMAHSYVQAFGDDETAFRAFAADARVPPAFLVDTYDVARGVRAAARVVHDLPPGTPAAVRIDSGDLAAGARLARSLLDAEGLPGVRIVVSGGLDEYRVAELVASGAPVDVFGVGTAVGVGDDAPTLDSAYKLVEYDRRPVLKLSAGKATWPGRKQVWRSPGRVGPDDVLALREEPGPPGAVALLEPAMRDGVRIRPRAGVAVARSHLRDGLDLLPAATLDLRSPQVPRCVPSAALARLAKELGRR